MIDLTDQDVADLRGLLEAELPPIGSEPDCDDDHARQARCAALLAKLS